MKILKMLLLAAICGTETLKADHDITTDQTLLMELMFGTANQHIQPNGVKMYEDAIGFAGLHVWHVPSGIYFETLARAGFEGHHAHEKENEIDFGIGINQKVFSSDFRFDLSFTYDHNIHQGMETLDDFMRYKLIIGLDRKEIRRDLKISPFFGLEIYETMNHESRHIENGSLYHLIGVDLKSTWREWKILFTPSLSWDDGFMRARPGFVLTGQIALEREIQKGLFVTCGLTGMVSRNSNCTISGAIEYRW